MLSMLSLPLLLSACPENHPIDELTPNRIHPGSNHQPSTNIDNSSIQDSTHNTESSPLDQDNENNYDPDMKSIIDMPPPKAILAATPSGNLCLISKTTGSIIQSEPAQAIDIFASPQSPGIAMVSEWNEDGSGSITELTITDSGLTRDETTELSIDNTKLIYGPNPATFALGIREGTTLFSGAEGRTIFATSSFFTQTCPNHIHIWLLEQAEYLPQLLSIQWGASGFLEDQNTRIQTPEYENPPKLIRDAPDPLIVGIDNGELVIQNSKSHQYASRKNAFDKSAWVQDAIWLGGSKYAILAGPNATLYILSAHHPHADRKYEASQKIHVDSAPRRLLAYDGDRKTLWTTIGGTIRVFDLSEDTLVPTDITVDCKAESITAVW